MNGDAAREADRPIRLVFILHGILINRWFCAPMAAFIGRRGFRVVNRSYPSTRRTIEEHAAHLERLVREVTTPLAEEGVPHEVNFVGHSLGALVVRYLLTHRAIPHVRRFVLLVPPNNGSKKARRFGRNLLYRFLYGTCSGAQLACEPPGIFAECGIPSGVEMGILAGVSGSFFTVPSRSVSGANDGVLTLEEVCLPGIPLKTVPYGHTTILFQRGAMEEVVHFLEHGRFRPHPPPVLAPEEELQAALGSSQRSQGSRNLFTRSA